MPPPITVKFAISGAKQLDAVFKSVNRRVRELDRANQRGGGSGGTSKAEAAQNRLIALEKKLEAAQVASAQRGSAAKAAAMRKEEVEAQRSFDRRLKAATRAKEKEERELTRIAARAESQRARQAMAETRRNARIGGRVSGTLGRAGRGTIGTVGGVVGGIGLTAGTYAMGAGLMENIALREQAALTVNATRNGQGDATQNVSDLVKRSQEAATTHGLKAGEVMQAFGTVAERGGGASGLEAFQANFDGLVKISKAFGVSMDDTAGVVAAMLNAGVTDGKDMVETFGAFAAMGKKGAIEVRNLSSELGRLSGAFNITELKGPEKLRTAVAFSQVAARARISPENSRTAVEDVINDITLQKERLDKSGIKVFGKSGQVRDPLQILEEMISGAETGGLKNLKGKSEKGADALFGRGKFTGTSKAIVSELHKVYLDAAKAGKDPRSALRGAITEFKGANLAPGEVEKGYATVMGTDSAKIAQQMAAFNASMADLLPAFRQLLPHVTKAAQAFASVAMWATKNPFTALGGIFAAHLTKELAGAGIGKGIEAAIASALGGNKAMQITGVAAIAITAAAVTIAIAEQIDKAGAESGKTKMGAAMGLTNLESEIRNQKGPVTAEQIARREALKKQYTEGSKGIPGKIAEAWQNLPAIAKAPLATFGAVPIGLAEAASGLYTGAEKREAGQGGTSGGIGGDTLNSRTQATITFLENVGTAAKKASDELAKIQAPDKSRDGAPVAGRR